MILTRASLLAPAGGRDRPSEHVACDLLWLHVTPADRVEHIRVRSSAGGFEIACFMLARDPRAAGRKARDICRQAVSGTPLLRGWKVL